MWRTMWSREREKEKKRDRWEETCLKREDSE